MDKGKIFSLAKKIKDTGLKGSAKIVSAVNGQRPRDAKKLINDKVEDVKIYTAESINAAEEFLEEHDAAGKLQRAANKVGEAYEALKTGGDKVADHFTNDHFDEQTAQIRHQLANEQDHDDDDDVDIVIDATSDDDKKADDDKDHESANDDSTDDDKD